MIRVKVFAADGFYCRVEAKSPHTEYTFQAWFPYSDIKVKHDHNRLSVPSPWCLDDTELKLYEEAFVEYMKILRNPPSHTKKEAIVNKWLLAGKIKF